MGKSKTPPKENLAQFMAGQTLLRQFELFKNLGQTVSIITNGQHPLPKDAWLQIERDSMRYHAQPPPDSRFTSTSGDAQLRLNGPTYSPKQNFTWSWITSIQNNPIPLGGWPAKQKPWISCAT